ncbi:uncharacterized protein LOC117110984 [Anneissia japonica]|uniref:uncharacterized protein LOC117110984 n=1 Tax=Anneissia japonica TaxID=1529436 RepID=UPI0014256F9D|nr:uncharacterized protein LOC117110984 [Anneissia japonica]
MMMLMDMCIGNEPLPSQEKKDIRYLIRDLRSLSSDIRVSPYYPSRSKVKHILERISIKLTLMADNMDSKQDLGSSLYAFFSMPSPIASPNKDRIAKHSRIDSDEELAYEHYHSLVSYEEDLEVKDKEINIKEEIEKDVQVEQNMETKSACSHSEKRFSIDCNIAQHCRVDSDKELEYKQCHSIVSYEEDLKVKNKESNIKEEREDVQVEQNMETVSAFSHTKKPFSIDRNLEILNQRVYEMEEQVVEQNNECGSLVGKVVSLLSDNIIRLINKSEQASKPSTSEKVVEDQFINHISTLENREGLMNKEEVLENFQYDAITGTNNDDSTECEAEIQFKHQDTSPDFIATSSWSLGQPYINYYQDEMIECINTPSSSPEKKKAHFEENIQNNACVKNDSKKKRSQRKLNFSGHHEEEADIIMTEPSISNTAGGVSCRTSSVERGIELNERELPSEGVEYDVDNDNKSRLLLITNQEFGLFGSNNCHIKHNSHKTPSNDSDVILSSLPCSESSTSLSGSIEAVLSQDLIYGRSLEQGQSLQNSEEMKSSQESGTSSQCSSIMDIFAVG